MPAHRPINEATDTDLQAFREAAGLSSPPFGGLRVADRPCQKVLLTEDATIKRVFDSLKVGDKVKIESPELKKARKLTVTSGPDKSGKRTYVGVASGHVRPGHRAGGMLTYTKDPVYGDAPHEVSFQPTMMQRPVVVTKLTRI